MKMTMVASSTISRSQALSPEDAVVEVLAKQRTKKIMTRSERRVPRISATSKTDVEVEAVAAIVETATVAGAEEAGVMTVAIGEAKETTTTAKVAVVAGTIAVVAGATNSHQAATEAGAVVAEATTGQQVTRWPTSETRKSIRRLRVSRKSDFSC